MTTALASLCDLVESLELERMPAKTMRQAGLDVLREQIRIIKTELRSMRRMLADRSKFDPERYKIEDQISIIERDLRIRRWESKKIRSLGA